MIETKSETFHFLEDGGELGKLVRSFDWSQTALGPVEHWPLSLRTIVDVILHCEVPMFLWWGDEMIQFYNDAYRPSLGQHGKHPQALGQRGKECWPEIWHIIKPLIDSVREGHAIWREDQLIPIFRNGTIEDVYWTFGYSPVRDESGTITGVLVVCNETTSQVNTRRQIDESEHTMRSIVLRAPVGVCILDGRALRPQVVNDIFLEIVDKTRAEFEFKTFWEVFPDLKEEYAYYFESVLLTGVPFSAREYKLTLMRNGTERTLYLDLAIEPLKPKKGDLNAKIMMLAIDVTDRVVARRQIEESEQRYKTLITESTVAIALYIGPELKIQYVNDIMTGYWGKDMSVIGKNLEEAVPELTGQRFLAQLERAFATGETYVGKEEEAFLRTGGNLRPFYFNYIYKPLKDSEGRIYGIHHMAMDVTEQVLARKKVEQSESILRNIILKAPVAMCILKGPAFVVEIANDLMFRLWGKERQELEHKPIFQGLPEARHQGFEEILELVYKTGQSFNAEAVPVSLPRDTGIETVFINYLYEAYREADGSISGVMTVATDITEEAKARHRVEELVAERTKALDESNKNLQRSNSELAQFAYIASHDLQEPARKITTFIELLQKNLKDVDPRSKNLLDKIEHSSARMLSLIRDILAYSQLSSEKQKSCKIDLNLVLNVVMEDFELLIEEKNATIRADQLPIIQGIPVQINQLFGNLISNALKFTHKTRQPRIDITCVSADESELNDHPELKHDNRYYKISFRDNGIGFDPNNAQQIFDIFQRLHGKAEYEGTGIGLAMCKKIAQNHNGDIIAESHEDQGATFHVLLPEI